MMATEEVQVRRGVAMVGPPYLYNGAQVCGRRTGRTCIFLLAAFGTALAMIGLVLLTADLMMKEGLWIAGTLFILVGVMLLVWFLTLCCAARCAFKALPPSHPARATPSTTVLVPPRSSTYQLLPMTPMRTQVTPSSRMSATQTLPISVTQKGRAAEAAGYPTWGHGGRTMGYSGSQSGFRPVVDTSPSAPGYADVLHGPMGYTRDYTFREYSTPNPLTAHTLTRHSPVPTHPTVPRPLIFAERYFNPTPTNAQPTPYRTDDHPPPYHTVVSGP